VKQKMRVLQLIFKILMVIGWQSRSCSSFYLRIMMIRRM